MDSEGANIPMGPNGPCSKLIYLVGMGYEGRIGSMFTFVHKGILVIMQGCIGVCEQLINYAPFWVRLSDLSPRGLKSLKPT